MAISDGSSTRANQTPITALREQLLNDGREIIDAARASSPEAAANPDMAFKRLRRFDDQLAEMRPGVSVAQALDSLEHSHPGADLEETPTLRFIANSTSIQDGLSGLKLALTNPKAGLAQLSHAISTRRAAFRRIEHVESNYLTHQAVHASVVSAIRGRLGSSGASLNASN